MIVYSHMNMYKKKSTVHLLHCHKPRAHTLVIQLAEQGYSTEDPVLLGQVCGELEAEDKVGGVARG